MKVYIYERTCTNSLQHKNYTEQGFKSYSQAYSYLRKLNRSYNASATIVSKLDINTAIKRYCANNG